MKTRMMALLIALLLLMPAAHALAEEPPQTGIAVTKAAAQLLSTPQQNAGVLMTYYPGVRVEVVRLTDGQYAQVNVGSRPGTLTGYMRVADLAFTEASVRSVRGVRATCTFGEQKAIYSYMDELSQNMGQMLEYYPVLGVSADGWLHVCLGQGSPQDATGFVYRGADASGMSLSDAPYVYTQPMEGELTREEAVRIARDRILADGNPAHMSSAEDALPVTVEELNACTVDFEVLSYYTDSLYYLIFFRDEQGIYAGIELTVRGKEVTAFGYGNG